MTILHPAFDSIERGYAAWLRPGGESGPIEGQADSSPEWPAEPAGSEPELPDHVADAIRRQVAARPEARTPAAGDLIVIPAPGLTDGEAVEPQNPVAILLDEPIEGGWSGWLVGAHVDYAGDRDLVLESTLIEGGADPAPIAGMVMCWDRVALALPGQVSVLHRLTDTALEAARSLERAGTDPGIAATPGRMTMREIGDAVVVTGTPYRDDDPRTPYLRLARDLARRVSEPEYDDQGRVRRPDRDPPER